MNKLFGLLYTLVALGALLAHVFGSAVSFLDWSWLSWAMLVVALPKLAGTFFSVDLGGGGFDASSVTGGVTLAAVLLVAHHTLAGSFGAAGWDLGMATVVYVVAFGGDGLKMLKG